MAVVQRQNCVLRSVCLEACYSLHKVKTEQGVRTCNCSVPSGSHAELVDRTMIGEGAADRWAAIGSPLVGADLG